jgi:hypothetical protein
VTQRTRGKRKLLPSLSGRALLSRGDMKVNESAFTTLALLPVDGGVGSTSGKENPLDKLSRTH